MHAAGHAGLALSAGILLRGLGGQAMDAGSTRHPFGSSTDLSWIALSGLAAAVAKLVGGAGAARAEATVTAAVGSRVRQAVLDHVFAITRRGALASLTVHVADVEDGVLHGVLAEARALAQLVPLAVWLVWLAPGLAGRAALAFVAFGWLVSALRRAFKRSHREAAAASARVVAAADEAVRHAELWVTYGATERIRAHLTRAADAVARQSMRARVQSALASSTSEVLAALALVLVLAARGSLDLEARNLAPFAIAFFMAYRPLRELVEARLVIRRGERALAEALPDGVVPARALRTAPPPRTWDLAPLVLADVTTAHGGHPPLSLHVAPGSIVCLVGATGIGKTSLLRALLGLDPLRGGTVLYGSQALVGVGPGARPFAWVPQDAPVVHDTVDANVGLGGTATTLPDLPVRAGVVDPSALSGGERQWIAFARAVATGLPVLLLDEPTASLDPAAQRRLLEAVAALRGERTVLLVTHRAEPLAIADVVVRLEPQGTRTSIVGPGVISTASSRKRSPSSTYAP